MFLDKLLDIPQVKPHGTTLRQTDAGKLSGAHFAADCNHAHREQF